MRQERQHAPEIKKMMDFMREGDIIVVDSISRFVRNTKGKRGFCQLKRIHRHDNAARQFMLTVFAAMAQLERDCILERQREGIAIAKEQGKYKGRQPIKVDENAFQAECAKWRAGEITATEAMKRLGLKPNTFYRRAKNCNILEV